VSKMVADEVVEIERSLDLTGVPVKAMDPMGCVHSVCPKSIVRQRSRSVKPNVSKLQADLLGTAEVHRRWQAKVPSNRTMCCARIPKLPKKQ